MITMEKQQEEVTRLVRGIEMYTFDRRGMGGGPYIKVTYSWVQGLDAAVKWQQTMRRVDARGLYAKMLSEGFEKEVV